MAIKRRVKKALNFLQNAYRCGVVPYPRVDNNFKRGNNQQPFPHPPLPKIMQWMRGVDDVSLKVEEKADVLLFLHASGMVTPSRIEEVSGTLDLYFDDDLTFVSDEAKEEAEKILQIYDRILKEEGVSEKELIEMRQRFFDEAQKIANEALIFDQKSLFFYPVRGKRRDKKREWLRLAGSRKPDAPRGDIHEVARIRDAVTMFREREHVKRRKR